MFLCPGVEKNENTHKINKVTKRLVSEELSNLKLNIESIMNDTEKTPYKHGWNNVVI